MDPTEIDPVDPDAAPSPAADDPTLGAPAGLLPPGTSGGAETPETNIAEAVPDRAADQSLEPRYLIVIHNDDVTPYEYVLSILGRVFLLSEELAEHVAWTAHSEGSAIVIVRPREEAKRLIAVAHSRARMDGYPLRFTMEPEP
jgi:ATP-dependent Clp protease adaptor protein ClpS